MALTSAVCPSIRVTFVGSITLSWNITLPAARFVTGLLDALHSLLGPVRRACAVMDSFPGYIWWKIVRRSVIYCYYSGRPVLRIHVPFIRPAAADCSGKIVELDAEARNLENSLGRRRALIVGNESAALFLARPLERGVAAFHPLSSSRRYLA